MSGKVRVSRASRKLPRDKAFYFFTSIGNYTGEFAISLDEFAKKILDVDVKSLEFHLYRGDFERWINGTLEDVGFVFPTHFPFSATHILSFCDLLCRCKLLGLLAFH